MKANYQLSGHHLLFCSDLTTIRLAKVFCRLLHDYLSGGNPTIADAILDRLVSGALRINLKGDSMRKLRALKL